MSKTKKSFKNIIGLPSKLTWKDFLLILKEFRFVFYLYVALWIIYFILFIAFQDTTYTVLDKCFGKSFSSGLSASLLEDLLLSIVIGFVITIISMIVSNKTPEDHEFEKRIFAVLNRKGLELEPKSFFKNSIQSHLAYYDLVCCDLTINKYDGDEEAYSLETIRRHVIKNMCEDEPYQSHYSLGIEPDKEVKGVYGKIHYLTACGKKIIVPADNRFLSPGINTERYQVGIPANSETEVEFAYNMWIKAVTDDKVDIPFYLGTAKFTTKICINITNNLPPNRLLRLIARHFKFNLNREEDLSPTVYVISPGQQKLTIEIKSLYPGDEVKLFFLK